MFEDLPPRIKYWLTEAENDCCFLVGYENGPRERVGAIKAFLMGDSKPFRVMLGNGALAENGDIELKDMEPETFKTFLMCVYGASSLVIPRLNFEECAKLLYAVDKYLYVENFISDVVTELKDHMKQMITYENLFVCLSHPVCYKSQTSSFEKEMLQILRYDFEKIAKDDRFLGLSESAMSWILQQQPIHSREIEIWNAVLRWVKHKTGSDDGKILRSHIFGFLKSIRFLTMTFDEFRKEVASSKILLEEEIKGICEAFVLNKPCDIEHLCKSRSNRYNIKEVSTNIESSIINYPRSILIHCSVSSISDLENHICSKTYFWAEYLWCLGVEKAKRKGTEQDTLLVCLFCISGKNSTFSCRTSCELRLINRSRELDISKKITTTFNEEKRGIGCQLHDWITFLNPDNGFVKDNTLIFEAVIELLLEMQS